MVEKLYKEAAQSAQKGLELETKDADGYFVLGEVYRGGYKAYKKAEDSYGRAIQLDSSHWEAYYKLGNLKYRLKLYGVAKRLYERCLEINPSYYKARINMGMCLYQEDNLRGARKILNGVLQTRGVQQDVNSRYLVSVTLGYIEKSLKDYVAAEKHLRVATGLKRKAVDFVLLGIIYEAKGKWSMARKTYEDALEVDGSSKEALYNLGRLVMEREGKRGLRKAIQYFDGVLKVDVDHEKANINAGLCYVRLGEGDMAKLYFDRMLDLDENHPKANIEMAKYWKKKALLTKALAHAEKSVASERQTNEKAMYYNEVGYIHLEAERMQKALEAFVESKRLVPGNADTLKNLIKVYAETEKWNKAISETLVLLNIQKKAYEYYENLGRMYLKVGKRSEAKKS